VTLAFCACARGEAFAQTDLSVEVGGSQIGPPLGVEGDVARFVVAGMRGSQFASNGSGLFASVVFGQTLDDAVGGSFLSGSLEGSLARRWTASWST